MSKHQLSAIGNTLGLVLLFSFVLPVAASLSARFQPGTPWHYFALVSPYESFSFAPEVRYVGHGTGYWLSLFCSHITGWILLAVASMVLPRHWQEGAGALGSKGFLRQSRNR